MRKAPTIVALIVTAASALPLTYAKDKNDEEMSFSWTAEESCLVGAPGAFTPGGDRDKWLFGDSRGGPG